MASPGGRPVGSGAPTIPRAGAVPTHTKSYKRGAATPLPPSSARTRSGQGRPASTNRPGSTAQTAAPPGQQGRSLGRRANVDIPPPVLVTVTPAKTVRPGPLSRAPRRATKPHGR